MELSLKPSAVADPSSYIALDAALAAKVPALGDLVMGYVATVGSGSCFVRVCSCVSSATTLSRSSPSSSPPARSWWVA